MTTSTVDAPRSTLHARPGAKPAWSVERGAIVGLLLTCLACGGGKPSDAAAAAEPGGSAGNRGAESGGRGNRGPGGGGTGGGPGGRGASTIMLSGSDVATAKRGDIEAAVPVTGDLRPIEVIDVRARIEGDLDAVLVREGQQVAAGQLLARFESAAQQSDRASAEADLVSARTALNTAEWNLQQAEELFKAGAIAERDLRVARGDAGAARARVAAAEARVQATSITTRDTRVVAPSSGVVEKRLVAPGMHVTRGASLFSLVRGEVLELAAAVPSRLASDVRPGQVVHFVADGRRFDGNVARVSPTIDPTTRSATVYVQIPNPSGAIKGNTFATGRVVARGVSGALLIPTTAVRQGPEADAKPFVWKLAGDKLARASVSLGIVDEAQGMAEVIAGLEAGDRVVAGNVGTLGNGMKVQILDADPNRRGNGGGAPVAPPSGGGSGRGGGRRGPRTSS